VALASAERGRLGHLEGHGLVSSRVVSDFGLYPDASCSDENEHS
jgi:hypothetical protein